MLKSLEIRNFRGFKNLTIEKLQRVNLITGRNNTGKTALLEAVYWLMGGEQQAPQGFPGALRPTSPQDQVENFWRWLFFAKDERNQLLIKARTEADDYLMLRGGTAPPGYDPVQGTVPEVIHNSSGFAFWRDNKPAAAAVVNSQNGGRVALFSTRPTNPEEDAKAFGEVVITPGGEEKVESLLREVEPRLKKIRPVQRQNMNAPLLFADIGLAEMIPSTQLGEGFNRLTTIFAALVSAKTRVCLIDEIENGLHYSVLCDVWRGLAAIARHENVQVFATTHSWECIIAAHEVFKSDDDYDFAVHRLERDTTGEIKVITLNRDDLEVADRGEWEVR